MWWDLIELLQMCDHPCIVNYHQYYYTMPDFFEEKIDHLMSNTEADKFFNKNAKDKILKIQKLGEVH